MLSLYLPVLKVRIAPYHPPKVTPSFLYHYDLMHLNIFNVFQSIALILVNAQFVPSSASGRLFKLTLATF